MTEYKQVVLPCPDPECKDGKIVIFDAYSENPLEGFEVDCDTCDGEGSVVRLISEYEVN